MHTWTKRNFKIIMSDTAFRLIEKKTLPNNFAEELLAVMMQSNIETASVSRHYEQVAVEFIFAEQPETQARLSLESQGIEKP